MQVQNTNLKQCSLEFISNDMRFPEKSWKNVVRGNYN